MQIDIGATFLTVVEFSLEFGFEFVGVVVLEIVNPAPPPPEVWNCGVRVVHVPRRSIWRKKKEKKEHGGIDGGEGIWE